MTLRSIIKDLIAAVRDPAQIPTKFKNRRLRKTPVRNSILSVDWGGLKDPASSKLCLFSTFDLQGRLDSYVLKYLHQLKRCGFDVVVITTSPSISEQDRQALLEISRAVIHRKNIGLDFASWKAGTEVITDWMSYESLLLANDSVYGPFSDLEPLFRSMDAAPEAVCGLTDSEEMMYHLQSYFLYLKRDAFRSHGFAEFWSKIRLEPVKYSIIIEFEMGISQAMLRSGFSLKAMFPYAQVEAKALAMGEKFQYAEKLRSEPVNPSVFMWDILLRDFAFPFIKTEILKINWLRLSHVPEWRSFIPEAGRSWIPLIEHHLERIQPALGSPPK